MNPLRQGFNSSLLRTLVCTGFMFSAPAFANTLPAGCDLREHASMAVTYTDDLRPAGTATINGATVSVMLSTGAAESAVFNKKTLDRLGIEVRTSMSTMNVDDARNPTGLDIVREVKHASIKEFSLGAGKKKSGTYKVEDFMDDSFGLRVGAGTLLQTDLEIALDAGYLKSFRPDGCFRAHLAYWDPQAVAVPAMSDPWKRDLRIVFNARIDGRNVTALLSTATPYSYLPKATAARLGLTPDSPGATREEPLPGHDADRPVWKLPMPSMSIGALEVRGLDLRLMDLPYEGDLLVLGADFLHRHRVYIAVSQQQIYFSPINAPRTLKRGAVEVIPKAAD